MLRHRVLTALVLMPVVLAAILLPDPRFFSGLIALIVTIGAHEWARLNRLASPMQKVYALLTLLLVVLIAYLHSTDVYVALIALASLFWVFAVITVVAYQKDRHLLPQSKVLLLSIGQLILIGTWSSLFYIKAFMPTGSGLLLLLMLIIWSADSGAYFVGKAWGKRHLAHRVSPGKTWEGTAGGLFSGLCIGAIYVIVFVQDSGQYPMIMGIMFLVVFFSVIGDLFESLVKRDANVKDSGQLLPGHGGVLDRIDSLTAAGPVFALGFLLLGSTT